MMKPEAGATRETISAFCTEWDDKYIGKEKVYTDKAWARGKDVGVRLGYDVDAAKTLARDMSRAARAVYREKVPAMP